MGAALGGRNQVDIAFGNHLSLFRQPDNCPADDFFFTLLIADKGLCRNSLVIRQVFKQIVPETIFKIPGLGFIGVFVCKCDGQARAQDRLGTHHMF